MRRGIPIVLACSLVLLDRVGVNRPRRGTPEHAFPLFAALVVSVLVLAGCMVSPRSAVFGQTALAGLGRGSAEAAASVGLAYRRDTSPEERQSDGSMATTVDNQVLIGGFEAHGLLGLADRLALNVHLSQAGIQPGLKIAILRRWLSLSVLPEIGIGYWWYNSEKQTDRGGGTMETETISKVPWFGLLVGMKVLLSTAIGLYGGIGYDFQYEWSDYMLSDAVNPDDFSRVSHLLAFAIGYEFRVRSLRLRPELAFVVAPAISISLQRQDSVGRRRSLK